MDGLQPIGEALAEILGGETGETLGQNNFDYEENERLLVESYNDRERGDPRGYECEHCKNRGYFWALKDGYKITITCPENCENKRRSLWRLRQSGLEPLIKACTFDSFKPISPWAREMKSDAEAFVADYAGKWFCTLGASGSGKTHICTAICSEFLEQGKDVRYMMWLDETVRIKAAAMDDALRSRLIEPLKKATVLYIDDLFKTDKGNNVTAADTRIAFEILNYRYINQDLITIISSEKLIRDILDIDEATGSRIRHRAKDYIIELLGTGKNYRLR